MTALGSGPLPLAAAPPVEHVLHVADRELLRRCGPAFVAATTGLCARGVRISVYTDDTTLVARLAGTPVECHCVPHLGTWRAWRLDLDLADRFDPPPSLVQMWDTTGLWWVQRWTRRAAIPLLVYVLGMRPLQWLLRGGVGAGHHFLVPSRTIAPLLARSLPQAAGRCRVIHPPLAPELSVSPPSGEKRTCAILCVNRLVPGCGLELLIDAVAQLRRSPCDVYVALVGAGGGLDALWRRIRAHGLRECISLVDEPGLWEKVLPEMDVCVVPAAERDLGMAPLLAMALGKVVIASRDQPAEWFIEDRTAWQFTPGSIVELAYLLARAIEQPRQAQALGESAAEYVRAHHAAQSVLDEWLTVYGEVLAGIGRRGHGNSG